MLNPSRQDFHLNCDYCGFDTSDRGGLLHIVEASGITLARYVADPSGLFVLGFQYNDIEYIDHSRQTYQGNMRRVAEPWDTVYALTDGEVETDWVHLTGTPSRGAPAYAGPSGMVTDSASFGGEKIGIFIGNLKPEPHLLTYRGRGFTTSYQEECTHAIITDNNPADKVFVQSDGYIKVRITQKHILRGRSN